MQCSVVAKEIIELWSCCELPVVLFQPRTQGPSALPPVSVAGKDPGVMRSRDKL